MLRSRNGHEDAFERLYRRHAPGVFRLARWLLSTSDVEDVVQDVFVRAWSRLDTLEEPAAFPGWLRRLATNVILRHRERSGRVEEHRAPMEAAEEVGTRPRGGRGIDLDRAMAELPEGARNVFILYDVEGLSHKEIADLLGISAPTSRSQLSRARLLLRDSLR